MPCKSLAVTLWESEEAANTLRSETAEAIGTQMVGVERYEVAVVG